MMLGDHCDPCLADTYSLSITNRLRSSRKARPAMALNAPQSNATLELRRNPRLDEESADRVAPMRLRLASIVLFCSVLPAQQNSSHAKMGRALAAVDALVLPFIEGGIRLAPNLALTDGPLVLATP